MLFITKSMGFLLVNSALPEAEKTFQIRSLYEKMRTSHHTPGVISSSEKYRFAQRKQFLACLLHRPYPRDLSLSFTRWHSLQYMKQNIPFPCLSLSYTKQHLGTFTECFCAPKQNLCLQPENCIHQKIKSFIRDNDMPEQGVKCIERDFFLSNFFYLFYAKR